MVKIIKTIDISSKEEIKPNELNHAMAVLEVEQIAYEENFYQRKSHKITASSIITSFWEMMEHNKNSLRSWALHTGLHIGDTLSKQAIDQRLNAPMLSTVKRILEQAILKSNQMVQLNQMLAKKIKKDKKLSAAAANYFNNILLHDSTIQQLPNQLYNEFGGNQTKDGPRTLMRIQAIYNLSNCTWVDFSIDTYRKNDQSRAKFALDKLEAKDLVIRDLGYFVLDALEQIAENQYIITNLKPNVHIFTGQGEFIDLLKVLKKSKSKQLDINVLVGAKKRLPFRLVANKLSKKQKDRRVKEAKEKAHSNCNYSEEYYELLAYEIYLTNVDASILSVEQIAKLYGLRWYIEIIFKAWKSYFNFKNIFEKTRMTYHRTIISVYLILIQFVYINNYVFQFIKKHVENKDKHLSIIKFMDVVNSLLPFILNIQSIDDLNVLLIQFDKHAVYDKRNDRKNMMLKYQYFKELNFF